MEQLKRWLKCRGLKQSGKRCDLLRRVEDCIKSGNHSVLDPSIDNGKWLESKELKQSESTAKNVKSTVEIPKSGWKPFPSKDIPALFNYGHVYHYTLESLPTLPTDQWGDDSSEDENGLGHMTDKPFKAGRKYIDSGFVHDITDTKTDDNYLCERMCGLLCEAICRTMSQLFCQIKVEQWSMLVVIPVRYQHWDDAATL